MMREWTVLFGSGLNSHILDTGPDLSPMHTRTAYAANACPVAYNQSLRPVVGWAGKLHGRTRELESGPHWVAGLGTT